MLHINQIKNYFRRHSIFVRKLMLNEAIPHFLNTFRHLPIVSYTLLSVNCNLHFILVDSLIIILNNMAPLNVKVLSGEMCVLGRTAWPSGFNPPRNFDKNYNNV